MDVGAGEGRYLSGTGGAEGQGAKRDDPEVLMTPQELQRYLRLGRTKTYELLAQNAIPSYLVGRLRRVKKSDVDRYLEARLS